MGFFEPTYRDYQSGIEGPVPGGWYGRAALDGDAYPWVQAPIGSMYIHKDGVTLNPWIKLKNDGRDDDWGTWGGINCLRERVTYGQFTDGGAAAGTYTLQQSIPVGAFVLRTVIENVVGFTGNTSATMAVGDGTDVDRYGSASLPSVFADVVALDAGAPSGTQVHVAAKTPVLTVTGNSDFTAISAGAATVSIYYLK